MNVDVQKEVKKDTLSNIFTYLNNIWAKIEQTLSETEGKIENWYENLCKIANIEYQCAKN